MNINQTSKNSEAPAETLKGNLNEISEIVSSEPYNLLPHLKQIGYLFTDKDDFLFIGLPLLTLLGLITFAIIGAFALVLKFL